MNTRYQVFINSIYSDLEEQTQDILQVLLQMNCIPCGMEFLPTQDEKQLKFVENVIDECNYYLLIIGGSESSITESEISYSEKEFDYAVKQNLKIITLIHGNIEKIEFDNFESNDRLKDKLDKFQKKVMTSQLVKFWKYEDELPQLVSLNLTKIIKMYPAQEKS